MKLPISGGQQRLHEKMGTLERAADALDARKIGLYAFAVVAFLVRWVDGRSLRATWFVRNIAAAMHLGKRTVERALSDAARAGLVERKTRYGPKGNRVASEYGLAAGVPPGEAGPSRPGRRHPSRPARRDRPASGGGVSTIPTYNDPLRARASPIEGALTPAPSSAHPEGRSDGSAELWQVALAWLARQPEGQGMLPWVKPLECSRAGDTVTLKAGLRNSGEKIEGDYRPLLLEALQSANSTIARLLIDWPKKGRGGRK